MDEIQAVYRLQGVKINDKHIEVIVKQMLRRLKITDAGDTNFLPGEQASASDVYEFNKKMVNKACGQQYGTYFVGDY